MVVEDAREELMRLRKKRSGNGEAGEIAYKTLLRDGRILLPVSGEI